MIQFYFLSIICNGAAGFLLTTDRVSAAESIEDSQKLSLGSETFRLVLGVLTSLSGILKLLSPVQGEVPVIGDIIPALAGLAAGFSLLFEYYRRTSTLQSRKTEELENFIGKNKKWIGIAALISAVLHFLIPQVTLF
ncbi:MAG: hypothetical protein LBK83_09675 [Treponema sp.]|jgi:uncharacterized membrane-anchored protein|nr:hypothetical protein [Treponema sp.]